MAPCPDLTPFTGGTLGDLVPYSKETIDSYNRCADRHDGLAKWERDREKAR